MGVRTRSISSRRGRPALVLAISIAASLAAAPSALAAAGDLDTGFGSGGFARLAAGTSINAVAAEPDGSSIAVGSSGANAIAVKLDSSGKPDNSFGKNGVATV